MPKAGIFTPLKIATLDQPFKEKIVDEINLKIDREYSDLSIETRKFKMSDYYDCLESIFGNFFSEPDPAWFDKEFDFSELSMLIVSKVFKASEQLAQSAYNRTDFTSHLVGYYIRNIEFIRNDKYPALSVVRLKIDAFKQVEFLKTVTYNAVIGSPQLKLVKRKADHVLRSLWEILVERNDGHELLPQRWRQIYDGYALNTEMQKRVICDFIASMTDRSCIEFYRRVFGSDGMSLDYYD